MRSSRYTSDTGSCGRGTTERIRSLFSDMNLRVVDAGDEFFEALKGVTDPEEKRKVIGEKFIRIFEREAKRTGGRRCSCRGDDPLRSYRE